MVYTSQVHPTIPSLRAMSYADQPTALHTGPHQGPLYEMVTSRVASTPLKGLLWLDGTRQVKWTRTKMLSPSASEHTLTRPCEWSLAVMWQLADQSVSPGSCCMMRGESSE